VPVAITRTVASVLLLYGGPVLAVLIVLPAQSVSGLTGFLDAVKAVFTVYGGSVHGTTVHLTGAGDVLGKAFAVGFIAALLTGGASWIMGADRALAASALDGGGPPRLGHISARFGTPVAANVCSGILATSVFLLAVHFAGDQPNKYFTAVLGLTISTTTISYLVIFPALGRLRRTRPDVARPSSVPGGTRGASITAGVCTAWAALATVVLLWPGLGVGWFGTGGSPSDALRALGFGGDRLAYELTQLLPLAALVVLGIACYALGAGTRRAATALDDLPVGPVTAMDPA
jgi:amino acid transporter